MKTNLRIGISAKCHHQSPAFYGQTNRHIQYLETSVAQWVARNGAIPMMIPIESDQSDIYANMLNPRAFAADLDGLILQGGVDIHPHTYGRSSDNMKYPTDIVRDRYEIELIKAFIDQKKPILGICRGMQLLNIFFGGTLLEDLESSGYAKHFDPLLEVDYSHNIEITNHGILSQLYSGSAKVISIHHQGIEKIGDGLVVEAFSVPDRIIEAISSISDDRFILAVQWHPEFHPSSDSEYFNPNSLLSTFVRVARNRKFYGTISIERKQQLKFSKSSILTLGAELELQIIHPKTFDLTPLGSALVGSLQNETKKIKSEIFQSMIEIETDICQNASEIEEDLKNSCNLLVKCADSHGVMIGSTGIHPFAKTSDRLVTPHQRYKDLMDSKQWIARRIAIFGLHCHVGVKNPEQGIELYRFYLSIAPLLLSLSASSPFFENENTGLRSIRSTFFESTPAGGHPPILKNWLDFEGLMTKLLKSKAISSHKDLWWDIRPSPDYGTIEIRICDSMPTVVENSALISLIHVLGHAFLYYKEYKAWPHLADWSYRENKWRALRYALDFDFIVNDDGNSVSARSYLSSLLVDLKDVFSNLGYDSYYKIIQDKLLAKSPACRYVELFEEKQDLKNIVRSYCNEFRDGLGYC